MKKNDQYQDAYVRRAYTGKRRSRRKATGRLVVMALLLAAIVIAVFLLLNKPAFRLSKRTLTVELGSALSMNKADYVTADPKIFDLIKFDTSTVNTLKAGEYPISVSYEDEKETVTVKVEDTTPPVAELVKGDVNVVVGNSLNAADLVASYKDHSAVTISFSANGQQLKQSFPAIGDKEVDLYLIDAAGNKQSYHLTVHVVPTDTVPPTLSGTSALSIQLGKSPDLTTGVEARDDVDGNLTDMITRAGDLNIYKAGSYTLTYSVKDRAGNQVSATRAITVTDPYKALRDTNQIIASDDPAIHAVLNPVLGYLGSRVSKMGIVYYDLKTGKSFAINQDTQFRSASTAKLFVTMALYDRVDKGQLSLTQKINYTSADYEGGTGIIQGMNKTGGFTLATLADYSMKYSDNIAFNMLRRFLGRDNTFAYYESVIGHATNRSNTSMGAADGYDLMKLLYSANSPNFKHMLDMLKQTIFSSMLPKYLPAGTVAHKVGFYGSFYHDVGLVYDEDRPYIIAVFSGGVTSPEETIAQVSKLIYENR